MLNDPLSRFRLVAFLEGCSFLLFAITMPLKYMMGITGPNYVIGMAHGVLFMLYVALLLDVAIRYKWSVKKILLAFAASLLPFGTFIAARKLYPEEPNLQRGNQR